jgi:hypothetical protein
MGMGGYRGCNHCRQVCAAVVKVEAAGKTAEKKYWHLISNTNC